MGFNQGIARPALISVLLGIGIALVSAQAHAIFGFEPHFRHGAVFARAVVMSEAGNPIYVEYDTSGEIVSELGEATGDLEDLSLMSGSEFRSYVTLLENFRTANQDGIAAGALLVTAAEYESTDYETVDEQSIAKPGLRPGTRSVLIRAQDRRFLTDGTQLVLLEFPVNLISTPTLDASVASLLLDDDGNVQVTSQNNIGYKVGYFGDSNRSFGRRYDDELHGPVGGALVEIGPFIGGATVTNADGRYSLSYIVPPCPGFTFEYSSPIYVELRYRNFNPRGGASIPYYLRRQDWTYCNGLGAFPPSYTLTGLMTQVAVIGILASQAQPIYKVDFPVDVMMLTGYSRITNAGVGGLGDVVLGGVTRYDSEIEDFEYVARDDFEYVARDDFDFDGDDTTDDAILGHWTERDGEIVFEPDDEGELQGIYLSSGNRDPASDDPDLSQPDFVRLADVIPNMNAEGLVTDLSFDDLENTDIYVFRKSNGQLVLEREGLQPSEVGSYVDSQVNQEAERFVYRLLIRGPRDAFAALTARNRDFTDWQSRAKIAPELHGREADHLRPGEEVQLVAINRATGYIGTVTTPLRSANDSGVAEISFPIEEILMRPPNLRVTARRAHSIEYGATRGDDLESMIGNEGAGLVSDDYIEIRTEWFDHDGTALPEALGEFGMTGRLARVSGAGQLSAVGGDLAQFPIRPGSHLQLVQLPEVELGEQHFYVHVSGEPTSRSPDFGVGSNTGILATRPDHYVPFLTQVFDESATLEQQRIYRELRRDDPDLEIDPPEPVYRDVYRPEFQFSMFDLDVAALNQTVGDDTVDILDAEHPVIASSDDLLEVLYSLGGSPLDPLDPFGEPRKLVFAFGEEEREATVADNQSLVFDNPDHLFDLDVPDFLTLRLHASNDAGNLLWQFAFLGLTVELVDEHDYLGGDIVYVSADEPEIDLAAVVVGFQNLDEDDRWAERVLWEVSEGQASLSDSVVDLDDQGVAEVTADINPVVGNQVVVRARLQNSEDSYAYSIRIGVLPGRPASIDLASGGTLFAQAQGTKNVDACVRDQHGNEVLDGTPVYLRARGPAFVQTFQTGTVACRTSGTIRGGVRSGPAYFTLESRGVVVGENFDVEPLDVELVTPLPSEVEAGTALSLTVRVTAAGAPAADVFVEVGADGGLVEQLDYLTDGAGEARFILHTPSEAAEIVLTLRADADLSVQSLVTVVDPTPPELELDEPMLVLGADGQSSTTVQNFRGEDVAVELAATSRAVLTGPPGGTVTLDFDGDHLINRTPLYLNRFETLTEDARGVSVGSYANVDREPTGPWPGLRSAVFSILPEDENGVRPRSVVTVPWSSRLTPAAPAVNLWLMPEQPGRILTLGAGALTLDLLEDGHLQASARVVGLPEPVVVRSTTPVTLGEWQQVAVGIRTGGLYLAVDRDRTSALLGGAFDVGGVPVPDSTEAREWLVFGDGFAGRLSLPRVADWAAPPVLELELDDTVFDANGEVTASVSVSPAFATGDGVGANLTIGLDMGHGDPVPVQAVDAAQVEHYAEVLSAISTDTDVTLDELDQEMSLAAHFPSVEQPIATLLQRQIGSGTALERLLAGLAYLELREETRGIVPALDRIAVHYSAYGESDLVRLLAIHFARAVAEAEAGNNLRLVTSRTALQVWSEVIDANPNAADFLVQVIHNKADLWTWMRFMSMPGNGWENPIVPIAQPDADCASLTPTVNAGTAWEYTPASCRLTGDVIADFIVGWGLADPEVVADPPLLVDMARTLMYSLAGAPYDLVRSLTVGSATSEALIASLVTDAPFGMQQAHAAVPALAFRAVLMTLKAALKSVGMAGVVNLKNFFTNGTTSRFSALQMVMAIAYLESRITAADGGAFDCTGTCLNPQVADNVRKNMAAWFLGIGLAQRGVIMSEDLTKSACVVSAAGHGAALELVATALYHALYEFIGRDEFRIVAADPRDGDIRPHVPIMYRRTAGEDPRHVGKSPHLRHPDLVLAGTDGKPRWIELKSWQFKDRYIRSRKLNSQFKIWDGKSNTSGLKHAEAAQRQHFIDYVATRNTLVDEWQDENSPIAPARRKPGAHQTWIQVWKEEDRTFRYKRRSARTGRIYTRTIQMPKPWIDATGVITPTMLQPRFELVQEYLAAKPKFSGYGKVFETSVGYRSDQHEANYIDRVVGRVDGKVAPFTIPHMLLVEGGGSAEQIIVDRLKEIIGSSDLGQYLRDGEPDLEALKQLLQEQIDENLGVIDDVLKEIDEWIPQWYKDLESAILDPVAGAMGDSVQKQISELEVPEAFAGLFGTLCEDP